ncbi:MAG: zinc-binding dehydrogenase [Desulfuromonadaceae bacterium]|nr:zinc-binding dehydrogenase [Desulfuromonadaceae bacterium]
MTKANQLWFTAPRSLEYREVELAEPGPEEIRVRTLYSGISAGTEMLAYRGQLPRNQSLDASMETLKGQSTTYPFQYGYANVGRVEAVGDQVDKGMLGTTVFALQPHASHYISKATCVVNLPTSMDPEAAVFLANMETAVNLVLDAKPLVGEKVVVLGQGVVGLLVSAILARFPLLGTYALECIQLRRDTARNLGIKNVIDPEKKNAVETLKATLDTTYAHGADLIVELTGSPTALDLAVDLCGYSGRIIVGSWYGDKPVTLKLGGRFHREHIAIVSSQVSSISPELSGRWNHARRFAVALDLIAQIKPEQLITHRIDYSCADAAYKLLDEAPETALQVILNYADL